MHRRTVDQASRDFDEVIEWAQHDPVEIVQDGAAVAYVLSPAALKSLLARNASAPRADVEKLMKKSTERHGDVYRALARWEQTHEPPEGKV